MIADAVMLIRVPKLRQEGNLTLDLDDVILCCVEVDDLECQDGASGIMNTFVDGTVGALADDIEFGKQLLDGHVPVRLNVLEDSRGGGGGGGGKGGGREGGGGGSQTGRGGHGGGQGERERRGTEGGGGMSQRKFNKED